MIKKVEAYQSEYNKLKFFDNEKKCKEYDDMMEFIHKFEEVKIYNINADNSNDEYFTAYSFYGVFGEVFKLLNCLVNTNHFMCKSIDEGDYKVNIDELCEVHKNDNGKWKDILYFECVRNFEDLYVEVPYIIKAHSIKKFIEKSEENLVKNKELYSDYCA